MALSKKSQVAVGNVAKTFLNLRGLILKIYNVANWAKLSGSRAEGDFLRSFRSQGPNSFPFGSIVFYIHSITFPQDLTTLPLSTTCRCRRSAERKTLSRIRGVASRLVELLAIGDGHTGAWHIERCQ